MMINDELPITNYQRTNPYTLLQLTEKLIHDRYFDSYLTKNQLVILEKLLSIESSETKLNVWNELLKGNVTLKVENIETGIDSNEYYTGGGVVNLNEEETNEISDEVDYLSNFDLEEFNQQINGSSFIGNLSLKVRYVLWQCAIDVLYNKSEDLENDSEFEFSSFNGRDVLDYVLLDDDTYRSDDNKSLDNNNSKVETSKNDSNEDSDYDDDDDGNDVNDREDITKISEDSKHYATDIVTNIDDNGVLVINLKISKEFLTNIRSNNVEGMMKNWDKIYHNFEHDKDTMLKRLRLEKSDQLIETSKGRKRNYNQIDDEGNDKKQDGDTNDDDDDNDNRTNKKVEETRENLSEGNFENDFEGRPKDGKKPRHEPINIPVNLGAANLSLKYLMTSIQENKSKLSISDYELKHLIMDVRKNRSKWGSDDRIGQEELYEACEKVVMELRNYTEHSTPFLNKVSKREAPNYHQVIKKSMDLNTVLKKLKAFQYNSKQGFVDDIMLIWKNCLTYNSDPFHFLRSHAIAMQKKSLQLVPLIPDITIRNRTDVENELKNLEKDKEYEEEEDEEEVAGSGRKGLNMGAHKPAKVPNVDDIENKELSETLSELPIDDKGLDMSSENLIELSDDINQKKSEVEKPEITITVSDVSDKLAELEKNVDDLKEKKNAPESKSDTEDKMPANTSEPNDNSEIKEGLDKTIEKEEEDEDDDEDEDEDLGDSHGYFAEQDDDRDDIELSLWKSLTAKARAEICIKRSEYFKEGKLNNESPAFLKNPQKMKTFHQLFMEFREQKDQELNRKKLEQQSIMKNGFGTIVKQEEEEQFHLNAEQKLTGNELFDKGYDDFEVDNAQFLQEYDLVNAIPDITYKGIGSAVLDKEEDATINFLLSEGMSKNSIFTATVKQGLTPKLNKNICLIQQIRHICHKISLIRMLQSTKTQNNPNKLSSHIYKSLTLNDSLDIDPVSQLRTHDSKRNANLINRIMHKNISKLAMSSGFESTHSSAIDILTELSGEYLSNLIKTIKVHSESNSLNRKTKSQILHMALLENGINRPDDLYAYLESEYVKKTKKLQDLRGKLEVFLKDLLRPTLQELSERNFDDQSQSFVTGDFASEITGEDFFGFKDLGLDKEFGLLSSSVPLQMLTFQFQSADAETTVQVNKIQPEEHENIHYAKVTKEQLDNNNYWATLAPLLETASERTEAYQMKIAKLQDTSEDIVDIAKERSTDLIMEDDKMILKVKPGSKPRIPPTGKLSTVYKKKQLITAFLLPEEGEEEDENDEGEDADDNNYDMDDDGYSVVPKELAQYPLTHETNNTSVENLFDQGISPIGGSLSLSLT